MPVSEKDLLALLTASPESPIAVHSGNSGPEIWGVLDSLPPHRLKLRVTSVGTVVASSDTKVIAILQRSKVLIPRAAGEVEWMSLIAATLDSTKSFQDRMKLADCLLRGVATVHRHGHGGALVLVPTSNDSWKGHIKFSYEFDMSSALALRDRIQEWETAINEAKQIESRLMMGQNIETPSLVPMYIQAREGHRAIVDLTLRSIGNLSAIDGALVMDDKLTVLGFGTKLNGGPPEFDVKIYDALSGVIENDLVTKIGGTRHQSAARFVHENHDALAFVASQDGRLTLFAWVINDAKVMAVQNLEHFIWEYRQ
jgi:hypothetical protein